MPISLCSSCHGFALWKKGDNSAGRTPREDCRLLCAYSQLIDDIDVDWYNNDGGGGQFSINVEKGIVELTAHQNYLEQVLAHSSAVDLTTGEEVED